MQNLYFWRKILKRNFISFKNFLLFIELTFYNEMNESFFSRIWQMLKYWPAEHYKT